MIKQLMWVEDKCITPFTEYEVMPDDEKWKVKYINRDEPAKYATGHITKEDAMKWAYENHCEKMDEWIKPLSLADHVNALVDACHSQAVKGGWWHDLKTKEPLQRNKGEMLMLIVSEVAEAMEGNRKGLKDDHLPQYDMEDVEIADVLIRCFDYIGGHKLQTAQALEDKLAYNAKRADHKIENRIKDGGKKY